MRFEEIIVTTKVINFKRLREQRGFMFIFLTGARQRESEMPHLPLTSARIQLLNPKTTAGCPQSAM